MQAQRNKLNFEGQKIFVGIDVHKKERNSQHGGSCGRHSDQ